MAEQSLREFVNTHTLPTRVKVTEGIYNPEKSEWEFSNGDVLDLIRVVCPTVELTFVDTASGRRRTVTASTCSSCLFRILPYMPNHPGGNRSVHIGSVSELGRIWPTIVCSGSDVTADDGRRLVRKGDTLRPKRLIQKLGKYLLECSNQHSELVWLPIDTGISCYVIEDARSYTLAEIAEIPGRVERRLRLADDTVGGSGMSRIRGLPGDPDVDLFMKPVRRFIEIHPAESPGERIIVPIDVDITVAVRDDEYCGPSFAWHELAPFVAANYTKFPMVVSIADWSEEPVSLRTIDASVGDRVVLYRRDDVHKMACQVDFDHFAVPLDYDVPCRRVTTPHADVVDDQPLVVGDVPTSELPMNVIFDERSTASTTAIHDPLPRRRSVRLEFVFRDRCVLASKIKEGATCVRIPTRVGISVRYICQYKKQAVVPPLADTANCPEKLSEQTFDELKTKITYDNVPRQPEAESAPPRLPRKPIALPRETTGRSPDSSHHNKQPSASKITGKVAPPIPPRKSLTKKPPQGKVAPPIPPRKSLTKKPPQEPENKTTTLLDESSIAECVVEEEEDYEEVADLAEYNAALSEIFGHEDPPNISIPPNADISAFSWQEMVVFLHLTAMPPKSLLLFAKDKISGYQFSKLDNRQLAQYYIDFPIMRHFRNKSSKPGPMAEFV